MKSTGIVRKIDPLGRIVLPMELRKTLDIKEGDPLEIFVDGETIILSKYEPACVFCSSVKRIVIYKGRIYARIVRIGLRKFCDYKSLGNLSPKALCFVSYHKIINHKKLFYLNKLYYNRKYGNFY